jgi:hypothetical protein
MELDWEDTALRFNRYLVRSLGCTAAYIFRHIINGILLAPNYSR